MADFDVSKLSPVEKRKILQEFAAREKSKHLNKSVLEPTKRELQLAEMLEDSMFPKQKAFFMSRARRRVGFCTRRAGKSAKIGTLISTPNGPRAIETLQPGDAVYGWNRDDSVSVCRVTQLHDHGVIDVVDLRSSGVTVATCTEDHVWLTTHVAYPHWRKERAVRDFYHGCKIVRKSFAAPLGRVSEPHAYAIAALLGDGFGKGCGIIISSADELIPNAVAQTLGVIAKKNKGDNYNWQITTGRKKAVSVCHHYGDWCKGRYAHEKIADLHVIETWDRKSCLAFLAGLLDTDGTVDARCGKRLGIRIAMQAKSVIDAAEYLLTALFMLTPRRLTDNRDKYKNGAVYQVSITNSTEAARVLKALDPYIVTPRKKYKPKYEALAHINPNYTGVSVSPAGKAQCYDITVDNQTNLYLLANGLVTHNSIGAAKKFLANMLRNPTHSCLYLAQTAKAARLYMWKELKRFQIEHTLPFRFNETNLWMEHERGGGRLVLAGADKADEIEKYRGPNWMLAVLDEAASFGAHIENLIMEVIGPALRDHGGHLIMIGTAGKHKAGVFYEAAHGLRKRKSTGEPLWELHRWSLVDNPYLDKDARDLDLIMDEEGFSGPEDPRFKREYLGVWDIGDGERMFAYEPGKNDFDGNLPGRHDWRFWAGVDFGWNDDSAICVVAWAPTSRKVYVVETWAAPRQYADDIASRLMELKSRFGITRIVGDCGGYGKGVAMQIQRDYGIYITQARKTDKLSFVEFVNSAFLRGDIQIKRGDKLGQQLSEVSWNQTRTNAGNHERDDLVFSMVYVWRAVKDAGAGKKEMEQRPTETPLVRQEQREKLETIKNAKPGRIQDAQPWYLAPGQFGQPGKPHQSGGKTWRDMLKDG